MTPRERELLLQVRAREPFANPDPANLAASEAFDALCRELQDLERRGWITLALQRTYGGLGVWYAAAASLTREGRGALARNG